MLSIGNPSCSHSQPSDLAINDDDHQPQPPNFSIRDYVFKARSKNIRNNWPFREQHLQLCLDNGISDVLPPFQPPSLVREHCLRKGVESEQLPKCAKNTTLLDNGDTNLGPSLPLDSSVVANSDQYRHSLSDINACSATGHDLSEGFLAEQLKKCGLAVKLGTGGETSTPEDLLSNLITVSDPMASKVCPVCKSFTSSSNTTLNAHIDQCLSSDQSNATIDAVAEFPKPRVKPRKKRLMVDIYATAPRCTLEDLDRRNGTNWAATLAPVAPAIDANSETKRTKFASLPTPDGINLETERTKLLPSDTAIEGNVGDIYVDSNGTKILILSKCNDSPLVSRNNVKLKKHEKGFKEGCLMTKKKTMRPKFSKVMKDSLQKEKLRLVQWSKGETEAAATTDDVAEVPHEEVVSMPLMLNACDNVKSMVPSKLGHWVCSKRSHLSRKLDNKDISKGSEKMVLPKKKLSFRSTQPDSSPSSIHRTCVLNLSCPSEAMASPKTRGMNIVSSIGRGTESGKKISSLPSKRNSKLLLGGDSLADDCTTKISRPNARSNLAFKKRGPGISFEGLKVDKSERSINPRKYMKKRSILECSKWRGEKYPRADGESDGPTEDFVLGSSRANETSNIHQPNFLENQERSSGMADPTEITETGVRDCGAHLDSSAEEDVASVSRDENQEESPAETSTYDQEVQCGDAVSNGVVSRDDQIAGDQAEPMLQPGRLQTDTSSFQEPSPCSASDEETGLENTLENSSTAVARAESNQGRDKTVDMESSGSAVSTTSTISLPSPVDGATDESGADRLAEYNPLQDKSSSPLDNNMKLSAPAREPSCSCSENLLRESQLSSHTRKNIAANSFISPPVLSSIQAHPNLEPHGESVLTVDSSKSGMNVSAPCSGVQSSNPILRLMGKDLVVGKEESVQLPAFLPCETNYPSQPKIFSFGHPNNIGFISYHRPYNYQIQATGGHQISFQPVPGPYMLNSPYQHNMNVVTPPQRLPNPIIPSNQVPEVIMIDDDSGREAKPRTNATTLPQTIQNPNLMAPHRLYACLPPQNPYASKAFPSSQRETSEGSFMFPSPSSLYFSPTLR